MENLILRPKAATFCCAHNLPMHLFSLLVSSTGGYIMYVCCVCTFVQLPANSRQRLPWAQLEVSRLQSSTNQAARGGGRVGWYNGGWAEAHTSSCTHRKRTVRDSSSKWPIDMLYGRYAPIIIHDLQNAATHQKKIISDQSLKCKYLKTYVLPHFRTIAQYNRCCVKENGGYISRRSYMDNFWEQELFRNGNKSKIIKWRNFQMMLFRKLAYPTPSNFMSLYQGHYNEIRKSKQVLL